MSELFHVCIVLSAGTANVDNIVQLSFCMCDGVVHLNIMQATLCRPHGVARDFLHLNDAEDQLEHGCCRRACFVRMILHA